MKLTVRDLLDLPIFKNFKLLAGSGGLNRPIVKTDILDFEFVKGASMSREEILDEHSLVLTSFLFAKDDHSLILDAVKRMYSLNVGCVAYKPALVSDIPKEALDFANAHRFPIFQFGGDEFFEDIIFEVGNALKEGDDILELERDLSKILDGDLTSKEEFKIAKQINPNFKKYIKVIAVKDSINGGEENLIALTKKMSSMDKLSKKASLCKFRDECFIILSQDIVDEERFKALLADILFALQINREALCCGASSMHTAADGFGKALREAFWACNVAKLENSPMRNYRDIGIYRLIVPEIHSKNVRDYMYDYLAPLWNDKRELLDTACAYILSHGDLDQTCAKLFCHKNTIRYRLAKLHELLDPGSNDKEFHENLSIAIRIYMLAQFL